MYIYARKTQWTSGLLLLYDTDVDFTSRNNFANLGFLGFFAEVSVLVGTIPCFNQSILEEVIS